MGADTSSLKFSSNLPWLEASYQTSIVDFIVTQLKSMLKSRTSKVSAATIIAFVLVLAAASTTLAFSPSSKHEVAHSAHTATPRATTSTTSTTAAASNSNTKPSTLLGSDGVKASWVINQNKLPGTNSWRISQGASTAGITGFVNRTYAHIGQKITFYISTKAPSYKIYAYRMGYYGGKGGRLIWSSNELKGYLQHPCTLAATTNMISCDNWSPALTFTIPKSFVQGDYLFKLVGFGNRQSYIPLTIWDPSSKASYVIKNDVFTWQAWNPYGGYDFYSGLGSCPPGHYPLCSRARVVSFDRPYAYGSGAADFLGNEYPLVYWAEKHGLNVTYWTDQTVIRHPSLLRNHSALLSLGHDECWSLRERRAVENANHNQGLNVVFFGASAMLRHIRLQSSPLGSLREEVDYRNSYKDPLYRKGNPLEVTGNTWSSPPASWPENRFVGETYSGYVLNGSQPEPFVVSDASSWIFAGTGVHNGQKIPNVIQSDFDSFLPGYPHPSNLQILGNSRLQKNTVQDSLSTTSAGIYSNMSYYDNPSSKGGVLDTGTNNWINSLSSCDSKQTSCPTRYIRRITGNIFAAFGQGPAGIKHPSVANWQNLAN